MRVSRFQIFGLFGTLNHDIELKSGGITLIHGPNGSGKTTALKLLEAALSCRFDLFGNVEFSSLEISFTDGSSIVIEKVDFVPMIGAQQEIFQSDLDFFLGNIDSQSLNCQVALILGGETIHHSPVFLRGINAEDVRAELLKRPSHYVETISDGELLRSGVRNYLIKESKTLLNISEAVDYLLKKNLRNQIPIWYVRHVLNLKVASIYAQRLLDLNDLGENANPAVEVKEIVGTFSGDLVNRMRAIASKAAYLYQSNEKTFPKRLLQGHIEIEDEEVLKNKYENLQFRLKTLEKVGLRESSSNIDLPNVQLNETHKKVLSLYLTDMNQKLDVFDEIVSQLNLLVELLSRKLRRKTFSIDKDIGFFFESSAVVPLFLKPSALSSGEQHQLVILYKLIFSDEPNQLYLVDEPEISLHVEWQRQFLDDLIKIADLRGHHFIVATHSPQIINGRIDLAIGLDGGI